METADTAMYANGMDCFTKSVGYAGSDEHFRGRAENESPTSTGLRNVTVISTDPADRTKILCVDVN